MTSSAYEPDVQGSGGPAASVCEQQPVWVGTTGSALDESLKAALEGPLEAAFAAASTANGRFDHVITREHKIHRQTLASAITIEDEASFARAEEAYAEQNSSPIGLAHVEPDPAILGAQTTSSQSNATFHPGAWIGSTGLAATGGVQWETAPAIPSLAQQWETTPSIPRTELPAHPGAQQVAQSAAQPAAQSAPEATTQPAAPSSKRFATTGSLRKMESQKLRCMDDYEKPEDVCIFQWARTMTREWIAKESVKVITRIFGASDTRLLPHLDSLAELQHRRRFIDDAERLHARALSIREQHFGRTHSGCATNLTGLARICHDQGRYTHAEELFREAIRLHENAFRKLTFLNDKGLVNTAEREQALIRCLDASNQLAQMLGEQGRFAEAEQEYELVLEAWNGFPAEASQSVHTVVAAVLENYRAVQIASNRASNRETESSGSGKQTLVLNYLT